MNEKLMTDHALKRKRRDKNIALSYKKMMATPGAMRGKVLDILAEEHEMHPCTVWRIIKRQENQ